jgi:hypothetical protein
LAASSTLRRSRRPQEVSSTITVANQGSSASARRTPPSRSRLDRAAADTAGSSARAARVRPRSTYCSGARPSRRPPFICAPEIVALRGQALTESEQALFVGKFEVHEYSLAFTRHARPCAGHVFLFGSQDGMAGTLGRLRPLQRAMPGHDARGYVALKVPISPSR